MSQINLLDFNLAQLTDFMLSIGEKPYRAKQLFQCIHQQGIVDFALMTTLSKALRQKLSHLCETKLPEVVYQQASVDGTYKWLLKLHCGNCVEMVFIPERQRGTLCISSQVGCGLNCSFCSTGKQGFNRDLSSGEIITQLWIAQHNLAKAENNRQKVTNVVMMGMGEPLLNYSNVVTAMAVMMDDLAYGLAKRKVTLSTSGLVPQMEQLKKDSACALAVSLHAPNDALRNELVPVNKKYPLSLLMETCRQYFANEPRRKITFEYVMLKGVNDTVEHAKQLINLLINVPSKVNLIPFNPFLGAPYQCSTIKDMHIFRDKLIKKGVNTIIRKTRGDDIDAACGQLVGKVTDKTHRSRRWQEQKLIRFNEQRV